MIPPSSTPTPATETSTSEQSNAVANSTERCDHCGSQNSWIIHEVLLRGTLRFFCTHCLLRNHPVSFCPSCFEFYDSSPPDPSLRVSCSNCQSWTHIQCAIDGNSPFFLCPPCKNPSSFSFFRPIIGTNGGRFMDKSLSAVFLCAAEIAVSVMKKALSVAKCEADRIAGETVLARKRAREALEEDIILDAKEKASSANPNPQEVSIELSANRDKKQKTETESFATITNLGQLENNQGTEKQNLEVEMDVVKKES